MDANSTLLVLFAVAALTALLSVSIAGVLFYQFQKARRYITVLEQASDVTGYGLVLFDKRNQFVKANRHARAFLSGFFGTSKTRRPHSITLKAFFDYCYDQATDIEEDLLNILGRSPYKDERYNFREVIRTEQGNLCVVEAQLLHGGGTGGIIIDIGDAKQREEYVLRLNQQNHELFEAIEATTSGIIITKADEDGRHLITFVNRAVCEMFEYQRDDMLAQNFLDLSRDKGNVAVTKKLQKLLEEEKGGTLELQYLSRNQVRYWYDLKFTPVFDQDGQLELHIGIVSDISEMKAREAEISRGQKLDALGQLAAGVAHDFNNVLSIIDGYARLTAGVNQNNTKALGYIEKITTAANRGANLIKRMLTFSRHKIMDEDVIDLGETIREQEQLLQPLLTASIKFKIKCGQVPMYVECGQDTVTQILMNLVVNARDAMPRGGTLFVEVRPCDEQSLPPELINNEDQSYCVLSVTDSGTGIEPDVLERVFDPFFTTKEKDKGTGLGLSMIYGLVKQNGGIIKVDSKPGRGTTMNLYFPMTDKTPKVITGSFGNINEVKFDGYTVLLAEDEPDLRELVGNMLEERGMTVLRAADGHEALCLEDGFYGKIDLLLTDVVMPELNGVDLADLLSELQPEMKVIFMSGYPAKGQNAHIDIPVDSAFIAKPIDHGNLLRLIYQTLTADDGVSQGEGVRTPRWHSEDKYKTIPSREEHRS